MPHLVLLALLVAKATPVENAVEAVEEHTAELADNPKGESPIVHTDSFVLKDIKAGGEDAVFIVDLETDTIRDVNQKVKIKVLQANLAKRQLDFGVAK